MESRNDQGAPNMGPAPPAVCSPREFQAELNTRLNRAREFQEAFSIVLIKVDALEHARSAANGGSAEDDAHAVGGVIRQHVRRTDMVTHFEGGRFALLLDGTSDDGLGRLHKAVREHIHKGNGGGQPAEKKIWVGRARYPQDGQTGPLLIQRAKESLFRRMGVQQPTPGAPSQGASRPGRPARAPRRSVERPEPEQCAEAVRVLVADDQQNVRDRVAKVLVEEGYEVEAVDSGEAALLAFGRQHFQVVLTDVQMGGLGGIDLLKRVRSFRPETQVVVMADRRSREAVTDALRAGAYDFVSKPIDDTGALSQVVSRASEKARVAAEDQAYIERLERENRELRKANELHQELAVRDNLTGLHNRRYFQETLVREVLRCRRHCRVFSVAVVKIDGMVEIRASGAEGTADAVVREVSKIVRDTVRRSDLLARDGGDGFLLLLPESPGKRATGVGEKVRRSVSEHRFDEDIPGIGALTVSVGVAAFPGDGEEGPDLLAGAEGALQRAAAAGGNRVVSAGEKQGQRGPAS